MLLSIHDQYEWFKSYLCRFVDLRQMYLWQGLRMWVYATQNFLFFNTRSWSLSNTKFVHFSHIDLKQHLTRPTC